MSGWQCPAQYIDSFPQARYTNSAGELSLLRLTARLCSISTTFRRTPPPAPRLPSSLGGFYLSVHIRTLWSWKIERGHDIMKWQC